MVVTLFSVGMGAAIGVNYGFLFQFVDPLAVLVVSCGVALVVFNAIQLRDLPAYRKMLRARRGDVLLLNFFTVLGWVGSYISLRYIEPAIAVSCVAGLSPIATLLFSRLMRKDTSQTSRADLIASAGMLVVVVIQGIVVFGGKSGVGTMSSTDAAIGIIAIIANAIANGANGVIIKRFAEHGAKTSQIMACRVPLLVAVGIAYLVVVQPPMTPMLDYPISSVVAIIGSFMLIYIMQIAVKMTEPVTVVLLSNLGPVITLGLQAFDERLAFSTVSFGSVAVMCVLVGWSTLRRIRGPR